MRWPEGGFRERIGAESILIGCHHQLVFPKTGNVGESSDDARDKLEFFKGVYLVVDRGLYEDGAVAIDDK